MIPAALDAYGDSRLGKQDLAVYQLALRELSPVEARPFKLVRIATVALGADWRRPRSRWCNASKARAKLVELGYLRRGESNPRTYLLCIQRERAA